MITNNPDIDANRIIAGRCSSDGGMTMLFNHPDLFAAAFPICPATQSANVTDETIDSIKDIPIWFIHAQNDTTVNIDTTTNALVERLQAARTEVHTSIFAEAHDTTGRFDDENGVNAWQWLSKQIKVTVSSDIVNSETPSTSDKEPNVSVKTGDTVALAGLGALMMLTATGIYTARRKFD